MDMRSFQWRSRMALLVSAWNSGSISRKSSMVFLQSLYAGHSRSALGSFLHCAWYWFTCTVAAA